ncbi:MAG: hypothetical protein ACOZBZ_03415 [Patescibacteria group bacterium]
MEKELNQSMVEQEEKDRLQIFQNLIRNEPLIEVAPSLAGINPKAVKQESGSIYYGTGLCTARELSLALPFDVLAMVFVAERIRRTMGMKMIYHHIADTHAKSNKLFRDSEIDRQTASVREILTRMRENFGLENLEIILASEFAQSPEYTHIYNNIETDKHEYVKREMADMEWYREYKGVTVKMGWIIQASETNLGFDERVFDREYKDKIGGDLSFVYLEAGRTLDKTRPKASPYIHVAGENRILLRRGEDAARKLMQAKSIMGDKSLGGARRHLMGIVRLYEKLFGSLGRITFEEKVEAIIERATK